MTCLLSLRPPEGNWVDDSTTMQWAIPNGAVVCASTAPNLWVGAVVTAIDGSIFDGAISQPGDPHAEVAALAAAGDRVLGCHADRDVGAMCASRPHTTVYDAIVAAGIVMSSSASKIPIRVTGGGIAALAAAGLEVSVEQRSAEIEVQLGVRSGPDDRS